MKKNNLFLFLFLFTIIVTSYAQVKFETISLQNAISKAKKENKLIFLQLQSADCNQCNQVADKAFEDASLKNLKNNFILVKLNSDSKERAEFDKKFNT